MRFIEEFYLFECSGPLEQLIRISPFEGPQGRQRGTERGTEREREMINKSSFVINWFHSRFLFKHREFLLFSSSSSLHIPLSLSFYGHKELIEVELVNLWIPNPRYHLHQFFASCLVIIFWFDLFVHWTLLSSSFLSSESPSNCRILYTLVGLPWDLLLLLQGEYPHLSISGSFITSRDSLSICRFQSFSLN